MKSSDEALIVAVLYSAVGLGVVGLLVMLLAGVFVPDAPVCRSPAPPAVTTSPS